MTSVSLSFPPNLLFFFGFSMAFLASQNLSLNLAAVCCSVNASPGLVPSFRLSAPWSFD